MVRTRSHPLVAREGRTELRDQNEYPKGQSDDRLTKGRATRRIETEECYRVEKLAVPTGFEPVPPP